MKITDLVYNNRDKVTVSFEFIPPRKDFDSQLLVEKLKPLMEYKPLFVDVTTHRNEIIFDNVSPSRGTTIKGFVHKKHPSVLAVCETIRNAFDVEVMPHILCCGFTKSETEDLLLDLNFLGYDNVMALRGDKLPIEREFPVKSVCNNRSSDLINQILELNAGNPLDSTAHDICTDFCIGAACYPEKYFGSPSLEYDLGCYESVKSGADFFISQMFFRNEVFYDFVMNGPNKYVIPGIKVLSKESQMFSIPEKFYVSLPSELCQGLTEESGVEWAINQCKDLILKGFKHIHFYTMNSSLVCKVLKEIL